MRAHLVFFVFFGVVGAFIMSIGAFFLVMGLREIALGRSSLTWPVVEGRITASSIVQTTRPSGGGRRGTTGRARDWVPRLTYVYEVDGRIHEGHRIDFKTRASGRSGAEAELAGLAVDAKVPVHVDPSDPTRAVLRPGNGPMDWIPPAVGLLGVIVPPAFLLIARRMVRRGASGGDSQPSDA